ncbi:MAG: LytS/YhcK type 5TM receptor domain-containing protein [bacterium]|jgi:LytS/YehU family sensor histidine kinase|nr:LytS/YhcK type 5TM receptor domain-containing protein [bacterium]
MILSLINNISLLLALSMCYSVILRRWKPDTKAYPVASGILLGLITIAGMMNPFVFAEGIIIDGRTFIACIAGILGGPVSAALVVLIGGGYRIWSIGGVGVLSGIGYLCTSAALGVLYRLWKRDQEEFLHPLHLYGLGLVVSASMMGWMVALPSPQSWHALALCANIE